MSKSKKIGEFWHFQDLRALVFSGGGLCGGAFGSAIELLDSIMKTLGLCRHKQIKEYGGTSVGAIFATMLVLGFTPHEALVEFQKFEMPMVGDGVVGLLHNRAVMDVTKFRDQLCKWISYFGEVPHITFAQLFQNTGKKLVIAATLLNEYKAIYFSYTLTPHIRVVDALQATSAIPGLFSPFQFGPKRAFVDGAFTNNFPFEQFEPTTTLGFVLRRKTKVNISISNTLVEVTKHSIYCAFETLLNSKLQWLFLKFGHDHICTIGVNQELSLKLEPLTLKEEEDIVQAGARDFTKHLLVYAHIILWLVVYYEY
tara:strand:- start:5220 stop:6155 length:936 start_codon:yes stop_codon:yes gene_type:complete